MTRLEDEPQLIPVAPAAKRLGISRDTIDRLIKTNEVRAVTTGGRVMGAAKGDRQDREGRRERVFRNVSISVREHAH